MKKRMRKGWMLGIFFLFFCACSQKTDIYFEEYEKSTPDTQTIELENEASIQASEKEMQEAVSETEMQAEVYYVYLCGAVKNPGVYALPEGSRIYEAIQQAGGLTADADETLVNQAELITDGMMIQIYTHEEAASLEENAVGADMVKSEADNGKVNINTANVTELMTLPGIGSSKAEAIAAYREEHGNFSSIEDIMNVPGIKEGTFQQMKEHMKVNN